MKVKPNLREFLGFVANLAASLPRLLRPMSEGRVAIGFLVKGRKRCNICRKLGNETQHCGVHPLENRTLDNVDWREDRMLLPSPQTAHLPSPSGPKVYFYVSKESDTIIRQRKNIAPLLLWTGAATGLGLSTLSLGTATGIKTAPMAAIVPAIRASVFALNLSSHPRTLSSSCLGVLSCM